MKKKILYLLLFFSLFALPCNVEAKSKALVSSKEFYVSNSSLIPEQSTAASGIISNPILGSSTSGTISNSYSGSSSTKQVNTVYKAMKGFKKSVNVKSTKLYANNVYNTLYKAFIKDSYVQDAIYTYSYRYTYNKYTGRVYTIYLTYNASKKTLTKRYNSLKKAVTTAKNFIGTGLSKTEVLVAAHDYLIKRCTYDLPYSKKLETYKNSSSFTPNYNKHSAYGVLCLKSGVCSGYAYAYRLILAAYGIDCKFVESASMNHAWNLVKLNGKWYHVDVTWDDPDAATNWTKKGSGTLVYYTYFLLNDSEIWKQNHYGWTSSTQSSSTTYSNMPRYNSNQQFFSKGNWYIVKTNTTQTQYSYWRYSMTGSESCVAVSVMPFYLYKNRVFFQSDSTTLSSMNRDGSMMRDHDPNIGTSFTLASVDKNTNTFYLKSQYDTHSMVISDYDLRTTDYATSLSLSRSNIFIKKGKYATLTASIGPTYALNNKVTFKVTSAGKKIIQVTKTEAFRYRFKGKKKGTATITVTVPNTNLKKTCKVTVE